LSSHVTSLHWKSIIHAVSAPFLCRASDSTRGAMVACDRESHAILANCIVVRALTPSTQHPGRAHFESHPFARARRRRQRKQDFPALPASCNRSYRRRSACVASSAICFSCAAHQSRHRSPGNRSSFMLWEFLALRVPLIPFPAVPFPVDADVVAVI